MSLAVAGPADGAEPHRHHRLIMVRPGEAVSKRTWPGGPESRPLSPKGRKHVTRLARFLAGRDVDVTTILHGSGARERETAEVLATWLECRLLPDPRIEPGLTVTGLEAVLDDAAARDLRPSHRQRMLLVARDPTVSLLLVLMTDSPGVELAAGGAASLRIHDALHPGCASLGWLVEPSMLRGLRSRRARERTGTLEGGAGTERSLETVLS